MIHANVGVLPGGHKNHARTRFLGVESHATREEIKMAYKHSVFHFLGPFDPRLRNFRAWRHGSMIHSDWWRSDEGCTKDHRRGNCCVVKKV